jgi:putative redox protein
MSQLLEEDVRVSIGTDNFLTTIKSGKHQLIADEPESKGGKDKGASPYQLLLASLGSCSVITLKMYAQNKKWDLISVNVKLNMEQVQRENDKVMVITRKISLSGNLDDEQKERLLAVAKACPVAKILTGTVEIESSLEV